MTLADPPGRDLLINESGVRARSDNPRSRGPAPDLSRAQLPPLSTRRPRPARQAEHFIAPGWTPAHVDLSVFTFASAIARVRNGFEITTRATCCSSRRAIAKVLTVSSIAT